jgi:acyl-CoA reductase-like NAD-dependent aldehyde dehydrogenase
MAASELSFISVLALTKVAVVSVTVPRRAKLVYELGDALEKHLEELFELETLNNGRPICETRAQLAKVPARGFSCR